jgi:hypothetical protein
MKHRGYVFKPIDFEGISSNDCSPAPSIYSILQFNYGEFATVESQVGFNSYQLSVKERASKKAAAGRSKE